MRDIGRNYCDRKEAAAAREGGRGMEGIILFSPACGKRIKK
jgi:hypothetical protein